MHRLTTYRQTLERPTRATCPHSSYRTKNTRPSETIWNEILLEMRPSPSANITAQSKRKAVGRDTCCTIVNLLKLIRVVLTEWVTLELTEERPETKGGPTNFAAVTWANRCGGANEKRVGLVLRRLGRTPRSLKGLTKRRKSYSPL